MRAKLEQVSARSEQSFLCYKVTAAAFDFWWHYHPEYELTFITKGRGKRLVCDSYQDFSEGDLVLLGPMLPHTWVSEKIKKQHCEAIVIQFSTAFISSLLQYSELAAVEKILQKAARGVSFTGSQARLVHAMLQQMLTCSHIEKLALLLRVLHSLSSTKAVLLSSGIFKPLAGVANEQRINKVFHYVERGFRNIVTIEQAAKLIHLSESAFCRFFKKASGKTFSDYVNDIRIAHACSLLIETDKPVAQAAYESGFETLTYFNRVFLKKKGVQPAVFRKHYQPAGLI